MSEAEPTLYLAALCYGSSAHARHMRALLALERACAARALPLRLDLGGADALIGRGRAAALARFLRSGASHMLMVDPDRGFEPEQVFRLMDCGKDVIGARLPGGSTPAGLAAGPDGLIRVDAADAGFLMVRRAAARRLVEAYPHLRARLGDVSATELGEVAMVFDSLIEPGTGRYLADDESFCRRWRDLGGAVWLAPALGAAKRP